MHSTRENRSGRVVVQACVVGVEVTGDALVFHLDDGRSVSAPIDWYPRLVYATEEERREVVDAEDVDARRQREFSCAFSAARAAERVMSSVCATFVCGAVTESRALARGINSLCTNSGAAFAPHC